MTKHWMIAVSALLLVVLTMGLSLGALAGTTVTIQVSPSTILLGGDQAEDITVHAEIPCDSDMSLPSLNGILAERIFADDRGELVAKFSADAIKEIVEPGWEPLTLTGMTTDGEAFSGTDYVRVVEHAGSGATKGK